MNAFNEPTNTNNSANSMQDSSPLLLRQKKAPQQDVHCILGSAQPSARNPPPPGSCRFVFLYTA